MAVATAVSPAAQPALGLPCGELLIVGLASIAVGQGDTGADTEHTAALYCLDASQQFRLGSKQTASVQG
jgi:hypothetical protein